MTNKEKAIELLSQMSEPFKILALENLEKYPMNIKNELRDVSHAILESFNWDKTKQGFEFWSNVYHYYKYGSFLSEIPLQHRYEQAVKENEELKRKVAELESKLNTQTK